MYEYVDECEGTVDMVNDFWTYYEDDFKLDRNGNPHFSIQLLGCGAEFCYYLPESGWYHFTIDKDYLDNIEHNSLTIKCKKILFIFIENI